MNQNNDKLNTNLNTNFPPLVSPEMQEAIDKFYEQHPELNSDSYNEKNSWIQTFTGKKFFPLAPRIEDIDIIDIAHALSMICRYTGHASRFFSVAEHSVLVSYLGPEKYGLLHDSSEAMLTDLPSPIKRMPEFEFYRKLESNLQTLIYKKFGLLDPEPPELKKADLIMLSTEAHNLLDPLHPEWKTVYKPMPIQIKGLSPPEAEKLFLDRFYELFENITTL